MDSQNPSIEEQRQKIEMVVEETKYSPYYHTEEQSEPPINETETFPINNSGFHAVISKYECNICDKIFPDESNLETHLNKCHQKVNNELPVETLENPGQKDEVKLHKCQFPNCGKTFRKMYEVNRHAATHSDQKPFRCEYPGCLRYFKRECALTDHSIIHRVERPFRCDLSDCTKSFKRKRELDAHMRVHNVNKPAKCKQPGCQLSFKRKDDLVSHIRVHSDERPFRCEEDGCGQAFKRKNEMKVHMRVHSDAAPFKCSFEGCNKAYKWKLLLTGHERRSHGCDSTVGRKQSSKKRVQKRKLERNHDKDELDDRLKDARKCSNCAEVFEADDELQEHVRNCGAKFKFEFIEVVPIKTEYDAF